MKKKKTGYILIAAAVYIVLLIILTAGEGGRADSNIRNFWDALWYSVVTLTTVGYGDYYPVSPAGRIVGIVFVFLSIGVLAAAIFAAARWIRGRLIPFFRLQGLKGEKCCIFSEYNAASEALAADIQKQEPDCRMVFCGTREESRTVQGQKKRIVFLPDPVRETAEALSGGEEENRIFLISENLQKNYDDAEKLEGIPAARYCRGSEMDVSGEVRFFNAPQCCARLYWQKYPLEITERCVIIAGDGKYARALLEQAVLVNCRIPFAQTVYHVFGAWQDFRNYHPELGKILPQDETQTEHDALLFHESPWNADPALLKRADRLIFCSDAREVNAARAQETDRCFALKAEIYAFSPDEAVPQTAFGEVQEIFTSDLVIRSVLDSQARAMHEGYCRRTGAGPSWEALPPVLKESNRAAADHLLTKIRLLCGDDRKTADAENREAAYEIWQQAADREPYRRNEHERWLRFYLLYNWTYGPEKDEKTRRHPCITGYDALSAEEKAKDDGAWEQIALPADIKEEGR